MFQDMNKIIVGGALMFVFMILVLSKFGWVEMRVRLFERTKTSKYFTERNLLISSSFYAAWDY